VLEEEIHRKRSELVEKKKVGMACCMMVGLFAVIILV